MNLPFEEFERLTHADLVEIARDWLKRDCVVVVSEIAAYGLEQPDAIGWHGRETILIECKASRSDFLADKKKIFRQFLAQGLGDFRYYLAPIGVIKSETELPENFGWLEVNSMTGKLIKRKNAERQPEKFTSRETSILISLLRRIGQNAPKGCSVNFYTYETKNRTVLEVETTEISTINEDEQTLGSLREYLEFIEGEMDLYEKEDKADEGYLDLKREQDRVLEKIDDIQFAPELPCRESANDR